VFWNPLTPCHSELVSEPLPQGARGDEEVIAGSLLPLWGKGWGWG